MSVTVSAKIYIVPIYRDEKYMPMDRSLIARWHVSEAITGDNSAGSYILNAAFVGIQGIFGSHSLWAINFISFLCPGGALSASGQLKAEINTGERSSGTYGLYPSMYVTGNNSAGHIFQTLPYKYQFSAAGYSQMNLNLYPNTNTVDAYLSAGGYIYDERLI